jgi:hypothetical protein
MHRAGDMNLSLFSFPEFCILKEQELRTDYMKDVVLYEGIPTIFFNIFVSSILFDMNFQNP